MIPVEDKEKPAVFFADRKRGALRRRWVGPCLVGRVVTEEV